MLRQDRVRIELKRLMIRFREYDNRAMKNCNINI